MIPLRIPLKSGPVAHRIEHDDVCAVYGITTAHLNSLHLNLRLRLTQPSSVDVNSRAYPLGRR